MAFELKGKLKEVFDVEEGVSKKTNNTWMKRNFIVETDDKYDNLFCIEAFGSEAIALIDAFNIGDEVEVLFNIKCRHWKDDKYFTSLGLWKFVTEPIMGDVNVPQPEPAKDGSDTLQF